MGANKRGAQGHILLGICLTINILGQAMQNISLPLALSEGQDMSVFLVYTAFIYAMFFNVLSLVMGLFIKPNIVRLSEPQIMSTGFENAMNGVGTVFAGSEQRTALTLQMSGSLLINSVFAPLYKIYMYGCLRKLTPRLKMMWCCAMFLYCSAFVLTVADKVRHVSSGSISAWCLLFFAACAFGVTYNVRQDKLMEPLQLQKESISVAFKIAVDLLAKQCLWLFIFTWLAILLSLIPGVNEGGVLTQTTFYNSWGSFLSFQNKYMNLFNLSYLITYITSVFLNKFDSSFNMLTSNVSAVLSLWTGWVPSISMQTVGFYPSFALTIPAMVISILAIYPSFKYSLELRGIIESHIKYPATNSHPSDEDRISITVSEHP